MPGSPQLGAAEQSPRGWDRRRVAAWAIFITYLIAARLVGNLFPFSVFDMYQAHAPDVVARVLVLDARGVAAQVDAFEAYVCEGPSLTMREIERTCGPDHRPIDYVVRDQALFIREHRGVARSRDGLEPISLVSRVRGSGTEVGDSEVSDCAIARCWARRAGSDR